MRSTRLLSAVLAIGAILSLPVSSLRAMSVAAASAATHARVPGLYRITITAQRGAPSQHIDIVLDQGAGRTAGYLVSANSSTTLDDLDLEEGMLRATVTTNLGRGTLSLRMIGEDLRGTLTVGKQVFSVEGVRAL